MADLFTQLIRAKVYRRGAELIRRGTAELAEGRQTLFIHGLSASSQTDTARILGQEGIVCSDLRFVPQFGEAEESETDRIREQIEALQLHIKVKELQTEMWKSNGNFSARTSQPVAEVQEYIEGLPGRLEGINKDILATKKQIKELEKKWSQAQENENLPILAADVTAKSAGTYSFELRYFDSDPAWRPVYEVHSDSEGPLTMLMKGNITQSTYEDWKGVELSLLTGSPTMAGTVPQLHPILLDIRQPVTFARSNMMGMKAAAPAMAMEECMMDSAAGAADNTMIGLTMFEAEVDQNETSTEYRLPGTRDVQKNGKETVADIKTYSIPAEYRVVTVPKMDQSAYLVAAVKPGDLPVSSSIDTAVYLGNAYTGRVTLDPDLTKEEVELTLGKEERVFIGYKELPRKTTTTLLKGQQVVEYASEITLRNESGAPVNVVVKDQIPVSENKDIIVDPVELSGAKPEEGTGFVSWKAEVPAGGSKQIKLGYKVSRPKDKQISERRR